MSLQAVSDLLARFGSSNLLPRPRHEDANPEVQEFFKEIVVEQIDAIAGLHPDRELRVFFEDEARFGAQGTIARVWTPKGSRPRAVRQNGREWLYVMMAVGLSTGSASALIMPELNTVKCFTKHFMILHIYYNPYNLTYLNIICSVSTVVSSGKSGKNKRNPTRPVQYTSAFGA
jgi:hypothetical protein